jgi:hypothetical protein
MAQAHAQEKKAAAVCTPEWYEVSENHDGSIGPDERRSCPSSLSKGRCRVRTWRQSDLLDKGDTYEWSSKTDADSDPYQKEKVTIYKASNRYYYQLERHEGYVGDDYDWYGDDDEDDGNEYRIWAFSMLLSVHGTCRFDL